MIKMVPKRSVSPCPQPAKRFKHDHQVVDDHSEDEGGDETHPETPEALNDASESDDESTQASVLEEEEDYEAMIGTVYHIESEGESESEDVSQAEDEDEDEDAGIDADDEEATGSTSSTPAPSKFLSQDEIVQLKESQNGFLRQIPDAVHPLSEEKYDKLKHAAPGSNVYKFRQIFLKFAKIYFEALKMSRFQTSARDVFAKGRLAEKDRCHLSEKQMIDAALKGIPEEVQNHYGSDSPFDNEAILAGFPRAEKAFYSGGYIGIASWTDANHGDLEAVYHGQTNRTVANRIGQHKLTINGKGKPQAVSLVFKGAEDLGGRYDFRLTHLHHDDTPDAVITMCETFFMVKFGRVQNNPTFGYKFRVEIQNWIKKVQGDLQPPEDWVIVNNSLPTKEIERPIRREVIERKLRWFDKRRKIRAPGLCCVVCGDSHELAAQHGSELILWTKMGIVWCDACYSYRQKRRKIRGMSVWTNYLWPSPPSCVNCKTQDGSTLNLIVGERSWEKMFRCAACTRYYDKTRNPRPERLWLPHLRRLFRCEHCGGVENQLGTTFSPSQVNSSFHMLCKTCCALIPTRLRHKLSRGFLPWADGDQKAGVAPLPVGYVSHHNKSKR